MCKRQRKLTVSRLVILLFLCGLALASGACRSTQSSAEKVAEEYLKIRGIREVAFDLFYSDPNIPDRAYVSVTATHGFLSSEGKTQQEFLGLILKREGEDWQVEKITAYTKDKNQAGIILTDKKFAK
jgi:hypothetical protein